MDLGIPGSWNLCFLFSCEAWVAVSIPGSYKAFANVFDFSAVNHTYQHRQAALATED